MKIRRDLQSFDEIINSMAFDLADYKNFSVIEKIRFCDSAMKLARDYCCELWDFNKANYRTSFTFNKDILSLSTKDGLMALSLPNVLRLDNPYLIYKSCFHEMRHFYQYKKDAVMVAQNLNYNATGKVLDKEWAASMLEADADKFAYSCIVGMARHSLGSDSSFLKGGLNYAKLALASVKSSAKHFASRHAQNLSGILSSNLTSQEGEKGQSTYMQDAFPLVSMEELEGLNRAMLIRTITVKSVKPLSNGETANSTKKPLSVGYRLSNNSCASRETSNHLYDESNEDEIAKIFKPSNGEIGIDGNVNNLKYNLPSGGDALSSDVDSSLEMIGNYLDFRKTLGVYSLQNLSSQKVLSTQSVNYTSSCEDNVVGNVVCSDSTRLTLSCDFKGSCQQEGNTTSDVFQNLYKDRIEPVEECAQ